MYLIHSRFCLPIFFSRLFPVVLNLHIFIPFFSFIKSTEQNPSALKIKFPRAFLPQIPLPLSSVHILENYFRLTFLPLSSFFVCLTSRVLQFECRTRFECTLLRLKCPTKLLKKNFFFSRKTHPSIISLLDSKSNFWGHLSR